VPPHPAQLATLLRTQSGAGDALPVDLDLIAAWCGLEIAEIPLNGCLGLLLTVNGRAGILIKEGQIRGQRRFTIAHEFGHFAIPTHAGSASFLCLTDDMNTPAVDKTKEREANEFADELLMPRHLFLRDLKRRDPSFRTAKSLAASDRYDVSLTACAFRVARLTREPCALVCARGGIVLWKTWSENFYYALPGRGDPVPADSASAAVLRGESPSDDPESVPSGVWFEARRETEEVYESTFALPALGQVLSLIWVVEGQ
jgi:hypothetical protein